MREVRIYSCVLRKKIDTYNSLKTLFLIPQIIKMPSYFIQFELKVKKKINFFLLCLFLNKKLVDVAKKLIAYTSK